MIHKKASCKNEEMPSDKSFGLVFAVFFLLIAFLPLIRGEEIHYIFLGFSILFALISFTIPYILNPLNVIWTKLGFLLAKIGNPIFVGITFFTVIAPIGLLLRLLGKDLLSLKLQPEAQTYWVIKKKHHSNERSGYEHQF